MELIYFTDFAIQCLMRSADPNNWRSVLLSSYTPAVLRDQWSRTDMRHPVDFDISTKTNTYASESEGTGMLKYRIPILIQILQERDSPFVVMRGRGNVFCKVFNKALTWQNLKYHTS